MATVYANNFSYGESSKKLYGRVDLDIYGKSAATVENFFPMLQGGLKRRPGTVEMIKDISDKTRIIPYVYSVNSAYLIFLSSQLLQVYKDGALISSALTDYTEVELFEIQYTQSYDTLFLAHRNHKTMTLTHVGIDSFAFGFLEITPDRDNPDLFQLINNYPGCVSFYANKLWLASSIAEPYTIWISEPLIVGQRISFEMFDVISETTKEIKDAPWPTGWEDDNTLIYEEVTIEEDVITASNALKLVVGTASNDRIEWMCPSSYMVVGTASSEWVIPSTINAQQYSIAQVSGYGSASIQALISNNDILYIQSDKRRLRTYSYDTTNGSVSGDLTYSCDHILESGVIEQCWRRVPEPMAFFVLGNGNMAILSYNKMYTQQAWSLITIDGDIESVCILDGPNGQDVYMVTLRNGMRRLEKFDSTVLYDLAGTDDIEYTSTLITNPFENRTSLGAVKLGWKAMVKLLNNGEFKIGFVGSTLEESLANDLGNYVVELYNPLTPNLQLQIESVGNEDLTILAILTDLEV